MANLNKRIVYCIVLYGVELEESETFITLIHSFRMSNKKNKLNISVFDNTPRDDDKRETYFYEFDNFIEVNYFTENINRGLPYAYNKMVDIGHELNMEYIVLLDQDTTLPIDFYEKYVTNSSLSNINCPVVRSNNVIISPCKINNYRCSPFKKINLGEMELNKLSCINSGMMVSIPFFREIGGYNERLFLDFCDHDFIDKVKVKEKMINVIDVCLEQDFSNDVHTYEQSKHRYSIYIKDLKEYYKGRNWLKVFLYVDLPHVLQLSLTHKSFYFIKKRFLNYGQK
ncbi:hypothetical protein QK342_15340 [Myroides odoratimimus]|uniref:hypothetical protein n=1 Tax=Myroides odoratimimus TaxID=76832 RepID=UPI001039ECB8|nr:hypothetical protein [Myroides odoratimimus]QBK77616.1 hypothetical protein E0Z07_15285 [Myroides odoratimimus]WHT73063.1 hypothetical protein QK342_15340 [Myroides odoratimimus]WHU37646.1 hypothetical protein QNM93_15325 [Myroides odoratimimus]